MWQWLRSRIALHALQFWPAMDQATWRHPTRQQPAGNSQLHINEPRRLPLPRALLVPWVAQQRKVCAAHAVTRGREEERKVWFVGEAVVTGMVDPWAPSVRWNDGPEEAPCKSSVVLQLCTHTRFIRNNSGKIRQLQSSIVYGWILQQQARQPEDSATQKRMMQVEGVEKKNERRKNSSKAAKLMSTENFRTFRVFTFCWSFSCANGSKASELSCVFTYILP